MGVGGGERGKRETSSGGWGARGERGEREKSGGSGAEAKTQRKNSFWWTGMVLVVIRLVSVLIPIVTLCGQEKNRRKSCHSIYEWEELASYIPIAKPFLRHPSASGGVQLLCLPARCPPARCRSGEVRPVKCCFGMLPAGILPS